MGKDRRGGPLVAVAVAAIFLLPSAACGRLLASDEVDPDGGSTANPADGASAEADAGVGSIDADAACADGGVTSAAGHCYFRGPSDVDQATAAAACVEAGAHLATLTSSAEEQLVLPL